MPHPQDMNLSSRTEVMGRSLTVKDLALGRADSARGCLQGVDDTLVAPADAAVGERSSNQSNA